MAFWIDAWWEDQKQNRLEQEYLSAIESDITLAIAASERARDGNEQLNTAARSRLNVLLSTEALSDSLVDEILNESWATFRTRANLDTYADLLSTGSISIIQHQEVRLSLSKLKVAMDFEQLIFQDTLELARLFRPDLHKYVETGDMSMIAHIERDMIRMREIDNARKNDVIETGTKAREIIKTYLKKLQTD